MRKAFRVRIAVERAQKKAKGVPVIYLDDVGEPDDDGVFVSLEINASGERVALLIASTENCYAALGKLMRKMLPASNATKLS